MTEADQSPGAAAPTPPAAAADVFGDGLEVAVRFADLLARHGVERGLLGPREVPRLWERHLLNSAVLSELIPSGVRVVDVGSGAGLPGIPLKIARPELDVTLLEPMARRVHWLDEVVGRLGLELPVLRGRAEEPEVKRRLSGADVVTARAVAPLGQLCAWCLPLLRPGGALLAFKGESAPAEVERDRDAVLQAGGTAPEVVRCGVGRADPPAIVVRIGRARERAGAPGGGRRRDRRTRKDRR